jgi:hypothetical protein
VSSSKTGACRAQAFAARSRNLSAIQVNRVSSWRGLAPLLLFRSREPPPRGVLRDESGQRFPYYIGERTSLGEGDLAERLVLLRLDRSKERHGLRELLVPDPSAAA